MMSGRNSRPAQRAFQTYLSAGGATGIEDSMRNPVQAEFLSALHLFGCFALTFSSLLHADGSVLAACPLASDIAFNIINAPVIGSPVMDELRRQAKEQCLDRSTLLGYSSYDSDNDSDRSVQSKNALADRKVRGQMLHIDSVF